MAAAYAAVVSLMNTVEQIRNHPRLSTCFDNNQIGALGEHLDFLLEYVESYSCFGGGASEEVEDLERRIASAAHEAADVIESHVVDQIEAGLWEESPLLMADLQKIIQEMSLFKEVVAEVNEKRPEYVQKLMNSSAPAAPNGHRGSPMATTVGLDRSLDEIYFRLVRGSQCQEVITITGMSGIGKTTLARNAYENPFVMKSFERCAWANVSQDYNLRLTFLQLLSCLGVSTDKQVNLSEEELGRELKNPLSGVKYLIMLDGMWSMEAWDRMKDFFPENKNGSRIIVTTRISGLAFHISSHILKMYPLNVKESWGLLCQMAFGVESYPPEVEETGQVIVKSCRGIPFLISVVGSFLGKSSRKLDYWKYVAERLGSVSGSNEANHVRDVLLFCYDALPTCLKPCFLYMGMFPKHSEIRVSRLIKLWVAEGFLRPNLEEVGENCIIDLIDRKLILVSSRGSNKEPKLVRMNDYFRDLCMRIAEKEKFFSFVKAVNTPECTANERRVVVLDRTPEKLENPQFLHARSLISGSPALVSIKSRLLRVLVEVYSKPLDAAFEQVNLGFLAYESLHAPIDWMDEYKLPPSVSLLWNMQTLVLGKKMEIVVASSEIWKMQQLRHVNFYRFHLPDPPAADDKDDSILHNLQTLGTVLNLKCREEVSKRMPNIKKLRVFYDGRLGEGQRKYWYCLFIKLESLNCCFRKVPNRDDLLQNLKFPSLLKKLVLQDSELHWGDLSIIGLLPFLEVLKLKSQAVKGPRWESVEGEFRSLKYLEIDSCYLIYWTASRFPVLESLVLRRLYRLKEIPSEMAFITTLEEIHVVECSISAAISAARILKQQEESGHLQLQVRLSYGKEEVAELMAKMNPDNLKNLKELAALKAKIKSDKLQSEEVVELNAKMKPDNLTSYEVAELRKELREKMKPDDLQSKEMAELTAEMNSNNLQSRRLLINGL